MLSYWESIFHKPYDLAIIGAGITGLSAALFYLRENPGSRVVILEKGLYPVGASTRNAGFTCFGTIGELMDDLNHQPEQDVMDRVRRRFEGLKLLLNEADLKEVEHHMCGGHEIFIKDENFNSCKSQIEKFNHWLREISGVGNVYTDTVVNGYPAIHCRLEGALHSGKLVRHLLNKVTNLGADIRWNAPVSSIRGLTVNVKSAVEPYCTLRLSDQCQKSILSSHTSPGIYSRRVLAATNGFTSTISVENAHDNQSKTKEPKIPLVNPARGYVFVTNEIPGHGWKGTFHCNRGFYYWRDIGNRILLGGARNADLDGERTQIDGFNPVVKDTLIRFAIDVLKLKNWRIDYEWSGIMGFPEKGKTPHCTEIQPGVWLAAGLGGMGVALGMSLGRDAAGMITSSLKT